MEDMKMTFEEAMSLLEDWSILEGSEIGELWGALVHLGGKLSYIHDEDFTNALREHIISEAERAKQEWEIVEEEQTTTKKVITLEYRG